MGIFTEEAGIGVGRKNVEANAVESTCDSMTRIHLGLVEADEDAVELENVFAAIKELDEMISGQVAQRWISWHVQKQSVLFRNMATPFFTHVVHQSCDLGEVFVFIFL